MVTLTNAGSVPVLDTARFSVYSFPTRNDSPSFTSDVISLSAPDTSFPFSFRDTATPCVRLTSASYLEGSRTSTAREPTTEPLSTMITADTARAIISTGMPWNFRNFLFFIRCYLLPELSSSGMHTTSLRTGYRLLCTVPVCIHTQLRHSAYRRFP